MDQVQRDVFSAMQEGQPFKSYIKKAVGKVEVLLLNPFSNQPERMIIQGNPYKEEDKNKIIIDMWSEKEDMFFKRSNDYFLRKGYIVPYERNAAVAPEKSMDALSDDEMEAILNSKYMSLVHALEKMTTSVAVKRMLEMALYLDKSEKYIDLIKRTLADIQAKEMQPGKS